MVCCHIKEKVEGAKITKNTSLISPSPLLLKSSAATLPHCLTLHRHNAPFVCPIHTIMHVHVKKT